MLRQWAEWLDSIKYGVIRDNMEPEQWVHFQRKTFHYQRWAIYFLFENGNIYYLDED